MPNTNWQLAFIQGPVAPTGLQCLRENNSCVHVIRDICRRRWTKPYFEITSDSISQPHKLPHYTYYVREGKYVHGGRVLRAPWTKPALWLWSIHASPVWTRSSTIHHDLGVVNWAILMWPLRFERLRWLLEKQHHVLASTRMMLVSPFRYVLDPIWTVK